MVIIPANIIKELYPSIKWEWECKLWHKAHIFPKKCYKTF